MVITVLGDGAWGTAWANMLSQNGHTVKLWCYNAKVCSEINTKKINSIYLPHINLDKNLHTYTSLEKSLTDAQWICVSIPVKFLSNILTQAKKYLTPSQKFMILSKGVDNKHFLVSDLLSSTLGYSPPAVVVAGPSFARDLANKGLTGLTVASKSLKLANETAKIIQNEYCFCQISNDPTGVQICSIFKNLIATGLGILSGIDTPENSKAFFLTKILDELKVIIKKLGGNPQTILSLAGIGDIVLTGYSKQSKNFNLGLELSKPIGLNTFDTKIVRSSNSIKIDESENTAQVFLKMQKNWNIKVPLLSSLCKVITGEEPNDYFFKSLFLATKKVNN